MKIQPRFIRTLHLTWVSPERIKNTNGAGDGALSALLHDMSANRYHKEKTCQIQVSTNILSYLLIIPAQALFVFKPCLAEVLAQYSPSRSRRLTSA